MSWGSKRRVPFAVVLGLSITLGVLAGSSLAEGATPTEAPPAEPGWRASAASEAVSSAVSPDGDTVYTIGLEAREAPATRLNGSLVVTARDTADGDRQWRRVLPESGDAAGLDLAVDGDRVYVTGHVRAGSGALDPFVTAFDAEDGSVVWSHRAWTDASTSSALVERAREAPIVVAAWWSPGAPDAAALVGVNATTGEEAWTVRLPADTRLQPVSLEAGAHRVYLAAAPQDPGAPAGLQAAAVNATTGELAWHRTLADADGNGWALPSERVALDPAGDRLVVAASSGPAEGPRDPTLEALDPTTGAPLWTTTLAEADTVEDPVAVDVAPDEGVAVIATAREAADPEPGVDARVLFVDLASGAVVDEHAVDGAGDRRPLDVTVGPHDRRAYVTGWQGTDGAARAWAVGLDPATQQQTWAWTQETPVEDGTRAYAWNVAVTPDGGHALVTVRDAGTGPSEVVDLATGLSTGVAVDPGHQAGTAGLVGQATYELEASNTGDVPVTVDVDVRGLAPGWTASVTDERGDPVRELTLAPKAAAELTLTVWPPSTQAQGSSWANLTLDPHAGPREPVTAATHTTMDPTQPPANPVERPHRVAPPCAGLGPLPGALARQAGPVCQAGQELARKANAALEDPPPALAVPWDRGDEDPEEPDRRLDAWWETAASVQEPDLEGPRDHEGQWTVLGRGGEGISHGAVLEDGRGVYWANGGGIWDPDTPASWDPVEPNTALNGGSASVLPGGDVFGAGGTVSIHPVTGRRTSEVFTAEDEAWHRAANMTYKRWYPTSITLATGEAAVFSGITWNETTESYDHHDTVEVYDPETDTYEERGQRSLPLYPHGYSTPNGTLLLVGPQTTTVEYDPRTGETRDVAERVHDYRRDLMSVLLDAEEPEVLVFGGVHEPRSAEVFDGSNGSWHAVDSLHDPRQHGQAVLTPAGNVVAFGGEPHHGNSDEADGADGDINHVEIFLPEDETWIEGPHAQAEFAHHSTGLLYPDGRVVATNQDPADIHAYEPWYLFADPRPSLLEAPAQVAYGTSSSLVVEPGVGVDEAVAIRPGATTHSVNPGQRRVPLETVGLPGYPALHVAPMDRPGKAPPGTYMMFALAEDVPSEAAMVGVGDGALDVPAFPGNSQPLARGDPGPASAEVDAWPAAAEHHARHH